MTNVSEFFGHERVSDEMNLRGAHFALNHDEIRLPDLIEGIDISEPLARRIVSGLSNKGLIIPNGVQKLRTAGHPINIYAPTDLLAEKIGEYNDYQTGELAMDLGLEAEIVHSRSLETFAAARGIDARRLADPLDHLATVTDLHVGTVRHLALRSFAAANMSI